MTATPEPFDCYYCGQQRWHAPGATHRKEHIIPACLGGTLDLATSNVCKPCNERAGKEVDLPLGRDFFMVAARLRAHGAGLMPAVALGRVTWPGLERIEAYGVMPPRCTGHLPEPHAVSEPSGGLVFLVRNPTEPGDPRVWLSTPTGSETELEALIRVARRSRRFKGARILGDATTAKPGDAEFIAAFARALPHASRLFEIDLFAWHRGMVKIALGVACHHFGLTFVTSDAARLLRAVLWADPGAPDLRGVCGPARAKPCLTSCLHPGGQMHLVVLMRSASRVYVAINLFGQFESVVFLEGAEEFAACLPAEPTGLSAGVGWIVNLARHGGATSAAAIGAVPLAGLMRQAMRPGVPTNDDLAMDILRPTSGHRGARP